MLPAASPGSPYVSSTVGRGKSSSQQLHHLQRVDYSATVCWLGLYRLHRIRSGHSNAISGRRYEALSQFKHCAVGPLYWPPVPQRVQFKLCLLTFKALHGLAPTYLADLSSVPPNCISWKPTKAAFRHPHSDADFVTHPRSGIRRSRSHRLESARGGCTFDGVGQLS